jgi:hypothetical protein
LAGNAVQTGHIEAGAVQTSDIQNDAINATKIGFIGDTVGTVGGPESHHLLMGVFNGSIVEYRNVGMSGDATMINTGVLTIAANAIGSAEVANNTLTTADLAPNAVGSSELANGIVTTTKMSATTLITSGEAFSDVDTRIPTTASVIDYVAANAGGGGVGADSIGFAELADSSNLDANYTANLGGHSYSINLSGVGAMYIKDAGSTQHIFYNNGDVRLGNSNEIRIDTSTNRVGVMEAAPSFTLDVDGIMRATEGVKVGDNATCNATNVGLIRHRATCNVNPSRTSATSVCMQTGVVSYSWQVMKSFTFNDDVACPAPQCAEEGDDCEQHADCCQEDGLVCDARFGRCIVIF